MLTVYLVTLANTSNANALADSSGIYSSFLYIFSDYESDTTAAALTAFQYAAGGVIEILTVVFTVFYTIRIFAYLHNKRQEDLYGSLSIGKATLYFTKAASAFIFSIVPSLFFTGVISVISVCFGVPTAEIIAQNYVNLTIGALACVTAYGLISICCGTTFNSVIMFIALCISYPVSISFVKGVVKAFFTGFDSSVFSEGVISSLLNPIAAYSSYGSLKFIYWIFFSAVCIVVSAFLMKRRKAERAQTSFAYYLPCHIIKILVSFIFGMFLGMIFGSLNVFGYGYAGFVFGFILGSAVAFVISHLLFYKSFSKLLKTSISLAGLIVVVIAGVAVCNFDVFGYNDYIPSSDDVASAGYIDGTGCYFDNNASSVIAASADDFDSEEDIEDIIAIQNSALELTDFDSREKFSMIFNEMLYGYEPSESYCITYKLNSGKTVTRMYSYSDIYYSEDYDTDVYYDDSDSLDEEDPLTVDTEFTKKISQFIGCSADVTSKKTYVENYNCVFTAPQSLVYMCSVTGTTDDNTTGSNNYIDRYTSSVDKEDYANLEKIREAFLKDFSADTEKTDIVLYGIINDVYSDELYDYSDDTYIYDFDYVKELYPDVVCEIYLDFEDDYADEYFYSYESYYIPSTYTNTIKALQDAGILNDDLSLNAAY